MTSSKQDEYILLNKVKQLELEVSTLKKRLGELRKAKNQTVLKKEKEIVEVGLPFSSRRESCPAIGKEIKKQTKDVDQLSKMKEQLQAEYESRLAKHQEDLEKAEALNEFQRQQLQKLQQQLDEALAEKSSAAEEHAAEISNMNRENLLLLRENELLMAENTELRSKVEQLLEELKSAQVALEQSKKSETTGQQKQGDSLTLVKVTVWSEEYRKYMNGLEKRLVDLQQTQSFLRECMGKGLRRDWDQRNTNPRYKKDDDDDGDGGSASGGSPARDL